MLIIGAGLSGVLAGALTPDSKIYEAGPKRESDHRAVFRCRKVDLSIHTGIPFKKVTVHKSIWMDGKEMRPSPRLAHLYSRKVAGIITARSIFNTDTCTRYIPPVDFYDQLKKRCDITYNRIVTIDELTYNENPVISTIPLPSVCEMMYPSLNIDFLFKPIYVTTFTVDNCDSYCSVYYPSADTSIYRSSLTGNQLIIESMRQLKPFELADVTKSLGLPWSKDSTSGKLNHKQRLGKIIPINNEKRKSIIAELTIRNNIYSLGRYATWRTKVLLDDVLEDIFAIKRLMKGGNYAALNYSQGEK